MPTVTPSNLIARAPGDLASRAKLAALRALRTFLQGVVAALPSAGVGTQILSTDYLETFGYSVVAAGLAAAVTFLQNVISWLPVDSSQRSS